jgi:HK97 family phage portal protein
MGLLNKISKLFSDLGFINFQKDQKLSVTELTSLVDYASMIGNKNYLDQYIGWTYRAVQFKAVACARQEIRLYRQTTSRKVELADWSTEPILRDMYQFNEVQTLYEARLLLHIIYGLTGLVVIWVVEGTKRGSKDFYILNPERVSIETNKAGLPKMYKFRAVDGEEVSIPPEDLLIMRNPDPKNWLKGFSIVEASKYEHNTWEYAMRLNMNTFANQGKMQGILSIEGIGKEERERIENTLRSKYQGLKNPGKILVTGFTPKWIPFTSSLKDLDYIEGIEKMKADILGMHGVPSVLINGDGTYENTKEAEKIFAKYTIDPILKQEADMYTEQLLPRYYGSDSLQARKMYFEFGSAIQTDPQDQAKTTKIMLDAGFITLNEARIMNNLERLDDPDADKLPNKQSKQDGPKDTELSKTKKTSKLKEESIREELRKYMLQKTVDNEGQLIAKLKKFWEGQSKRAMEAIEVTQKGLQYDLMLNQEEEIALMLDYMREAYEAIGFDFNKLTNELLGENKPLSQGAKEMLKNNLQYFSDEVTKTTIDNLNDLLISAMERGAGLDELKEDIAKLFIGYSDNGGKVDTMTRAETIARTETGKIKNAISYERYRKSEKVVGKEWLATGGLNSRPAHNRLDGTVVGLDEYFSVNGYLALRPHAESLPASEVVNCRCDILPRIKEEYKSAVYMQYLELIDKIKK